MYHIHTLNCTANLQYGNVFPTPMYLRTVALFHWGGSGSAGNHAFSLFPQSGEDAMVEVQRKSRPVHSGSAGQVKSKGVPTSASHAQCVWKSFPVPFIIPGHSHVMLILWHCTRTAHLYVCEQTLVVKLVEIGDAKLVYGSVAIVHSSVWQFLFFALLQM